MFTQCLRRQQKEIVCLLKWHKYFNSANKKRHSVKMCSTGKIQFDKPSGFKLSNYDCIGFDLDNTIASYKIGPMMEMEYEILAHRMADKGYSKKHLFKPVNTDFLLKGLIIDNDNGNLLKIAPDGTILAASHGTKILNEEEMQKYYPTGHWEPTDLFAKDPLLTWNGPYSERMRTLLDYFDIACCLAYARTVDSIEEEGGYQKEKYYTVWSDMLNILQDMFSRDNFQLDKGIYFPKMKSAPEKYYNRSKSISKWLQLLKDNNKILFLITGAHVDFASLTASTALGPNWKDYFSFIVTYAKKPGFFTMRRDFMGLDGFKETTAIPYDKLELGGIYTHGNWHDLHKFLTKHSSTDNPKFLYIGDNLIQDIYTPSMYSKCDTLAICEELQAEGWEPQLRHPYEVFLKSSVWGSYFKDKGQSTIWLKIIKDHAKLCVPSLEYLCQFPLNHEHFCCDFLSDFK